MFLGEQTKAQDSSAKSDARNMVSQVESCYAVTEDYSRCSSSSALGETGLSWGTGPGQVAVLRASSDGYVIGATSQSGNSFYILKSAQYGIWRVCWPYNQGGCSRWATW